MQSTQTAVQAPPAQGGRMSSGRLKYAQPRDLPSFPSLGLRQNDTAASAAATLGWATQKSAAASPASPGEPAWRSPALNSSASPVSSPGISLASPASAAALLANSNRSKTGAPAPGPAAKQDLGSKAAVLAAASGLARSKQDSNAAAVAAASPRVPMASPALSPSSALSSTWGSSAANQAFRAGSVRQLNLALPPEQSPQMNMLRSGSLRAAKDAMAVSSSRPRALSSPVQQSPKSAGGLGITASSPVGGEDSGAASAASNALTAATAAHHRRAASTSDEAAGATGPYTTMGRQMFTTQPPVQQGTEDQKRADVLHASAVAMAKRIYSQQQQHEEQQKSADAAARAAQLNNSSQSPPPASQQQQAVPRPYVNLQEAAYKLAQERLSKLQEEHNRSRDYKEYYGSGAGTPSSPGHKRFTIRGKLRRRSSSDGAVSPISGFAATGAGETREQQRRRRARSMLSDGTMSPNVADSPSPANYDEKRQRDREALLAAARRNVKAQLEGIDRKVLADSGKVSPALLGDWEQKAHAAALARTAGASPTSPASLAAPAASPAGEGVSQTSPAEKPNSPRGNNSGRIDIGGGKFMDQSEIDEIAARRVQPFLDEINEKAEKERERLAALQAEEDRKRNEAEGKRAQEKEIKENLEKLKNQQKEQEKARKEEIKQEERARKQLEKETKLAQKRQSKLMTGATGQGQSQEEATEAKPLEEGTSEPLAQKRSSELRKKPSRALHSLSLRLPGKLNLNKDKGDTEIQQTSATSAPTSAAEQSATSATMSPTTAEELGSSPTSKMKTWLKSRFRGRSRSSAEAGSFAAGNGKKGGFIGGAALSGAAGGPTMQHHRAGSGSSMSSLGEPGADSMREVALAGVGNGGGPLSRTATANTANSRGVAARGSAASLASSNNASSLSSGSGVGGGGENFVLAKDHLSNNSVALPRPPGIKDPARTTKSGSPVRDSRFLEMME